MPLQSILPLCALSLAAAQQPIEAEVVTSALPDPLFVCAPPNDSAGRIFILNKSGTIWIHDQGALLAQPFLDLTARLQVGGEGLIGMAFHPEYEQNGYFYVHYIGLGGSSYIERYARDGRDPDQADPGSASLVIEIEQPYPNHNGGWLGFGPDGLLYIAMGDGGAQGDPGNLSQNGRDLHGKLLRLDVDGAPPYSIPTGNPFVGDPNVLDEIWALGLRNPWRCDFDPLTGDLWIADVGQQSWEEIDLQPAGVGGSNYGWRVMESQHCYSPSSGCNTAGLTLPVFEYPHGGARYRCAIIGGVVYRGRDMATMHGRYFFSDYCSGDTWSLRKQGAGVTDLAWHTAELPFNTIASMGRDSAGEAYVCADYKVFKIVPAGLRLRVGDLVAGAPSAALISGGSTHAGCGLFFSLAGLGSTPVPAAGVTLDVAMAQLVAVGQTSGLGTLSFPGTVPAGLQGRTLWMQAAQAGKVSNVVVAAVQ